MPHLALVVPCYNEAARLDVAAFTAARVPGCRLELIFVDDGSTDDTRAMLESIRQARPDDVRVVALPANRGKGEAVRAGVLDALARKPAFVGYWDADLSTPLEEVAALLRALEGDPAAQIALGSRVKLLGRHIDRRAWRHYAGRVFATAVSLVLRLPVYDTQCGAKVLRATPLVEQVFATPFASRWVFDVEILARCMTRDPAGRAHAVRGFVEVPLRQWNDAGGSKVTAAGAVRAAIDLARIWRQT